MHIGIIGAGIVGLATAYQLIKKDPSLKITIFEKEKGPAFHQTGRNSGVIHSGIYYKPGSLKAQNCLSGKKELLSFCEQFSIPTQKVGKVIVATDPAEIPRLDAIEEKGRANGVTLKRIGSAELREIEPHVTAIDALWIPEASIVSYKSVSEKIAEELKKMGGEIFFNTKIEKIERAQEKVVLQSGQNGWEVDLLINAAGVYSDKMAKLALGRSTHQILPFRGEYYELKEEKKDLVKGLIYPVPDPRFPFLGVHLTRMIDGKVEAGPNAILALAKEGYRKTDFNLREVSEILTYQGFWRIAAKYWKAGLYEIARSFSKRLFLKDLQRLVPAIEEKDLAPGGAGIRAQLVTKDGKLFDDFLILEEKNMIHVLNAPSPAATASFAIGKTLAEMVLYKSFSLIPTTDT